MTKKEFQSIITKNKDNYVCLSIKDATLVYGNPYFFIKIVWKNPMGTSVIHSGKGHHENIKAKEVNAKYQKWVNQILN
jgi:hypothetical protein